MKDSLSLSLSRVWGSQRRKKKKKKKRRRRRKKRRWIKASL